MAASLRTERRYLPPSRKDSKTGQGPAREKLSPVTGGHFPPSDVQNQRKFSVKSNKRYLSLKIIISTYKNINRNLKKRKRAFFYYFHNDMKNPSRSEQEKFQVELPIKLDSRK